MAKLRCEEATQLPAFLQRHMKANQRVELEPFRQTGNSVDEIVVIGGGGHAKVVVSILRKLKHYRILGYTDLQDRGSLLEASYLGADCELAALASRRQKLNAVLAIGQVGSGREHGTNSGRGCSRRPCLSLPLSLRGQSLTREFLVAMAQW